MHGRIIFGALAAVALGTLGLVLVVRDEPQAAPPRAIAPRADGDASEVLAMRREVAALRADVARLGGERAAPAPDEAPAEAARAPSDPAARAQAVLAEQHRAVAWLDARVATGARDPAWTSDVRAALTGSLEAGVGAVRAVDCGASLCRAEVAQPDPEKLRKFADELAGTHHRTFQLFYEPEGDALVASVFIARDGERLPDLAGAMRAKR